MGILVLLLFAVLGAAALSRYDKAGTGFLLGLFLGPIGLIFVLVIRSGENKKEELTRHEEQINVIKQINNDNDTRPVRECPYCAEIVLEKAKVCKHCGNDIENISSKNSIAENAK